jgi:YD repeat-containing protein
MFLRISATLNFVLGLLFIFETATYPVNALAAPTPILNILWHSGSGDGCTAASNVTARSPAAIFAPWVAAELSCQAADLTEAFTLIACTDEGPANDAAWHEFGCSFSNHVIYINGDQQTAYGNLPIIINCLSGSFYNNASQSCACPDATEWDDLHQSCLRFSDMYMGKPGTCPAIQDPIYPLTGTKRDDIELGIYVGGVQVKLTYDTSGHAPEVNGRLTWLVPPPASFGVNWQSNMHRSLLLQAGSGGAGSAFSSVVLQRGGALAETASVAGFDTCDPNGTGGGAPASLAYVPTVNLNERVILTGTGSAGSLVDGAGLTEEIYASDGTLNSIAQTRGGVLNFGYTAGLLSTVADQFGRTVQFGYEQPSGVPTARVNLVTAADGSTVQVGYDVSNNMNTLKWFDGSTQTLVYDDPTSAWALTGIIDESGQRFATYGYDSKGRAISAFSGNGVDRYDVTYDTPPAWNVIEQYLPSGNMICRVHQWQQPVNTRIQLPTSQIISMTATTPRGMVELGGQSQPAGSGCAASSSARTFDSVGNAVSHDDFNGNRFCYAYDLTRNLRTVTLDGLAGGVSGKACPADLSGYTPVETDSAHPERKTTTVWHPDWVLKAREAAPKKITTWVYNGQPDPVAGATASCVTPATVLPDGKPLGVLCARYEQATTDATGGLGLSATVSGATRAWTYTYNQYGQVLTETTPKQSPTDALSHTTTYAYYPTTNFSGSVGHTMGDLNTITNPLLQVTTFTSYDKAGRLLSSKDANLTVTSMTYWPRGWLHTQTVTPASGSQLTTTYDYWPTGLLKTVTLPDASTLNYVYDDAHRLTDVTDTAGNKIHYVLDNVGNRTSEQVSDASGRLASSVTWVYDQLNRVQSTTGAMH